MLGENSHENEKTQYLRAYKQTAFMVIKDLTLNKPYLRLMVFITCSARTRFCIWLVTKRMHCLPLIWCRRKPYTVTVRETQTQAQTYQTEKHGHVDETVMSHKLKCPGLK